MVTFIVIGLISLFFNCTNSLDNILRNRSIVQIALLLAGIIAIFGLLLFLQEYVTGFIYQGKEKINPLNLFAIFSQAINADANNTHGNAYIFQLIVSLIGAVCFGGLLISTISNVFQRRIEASAKGDVRYWRLSGHNIIIGANELLEPSLRNLYFDSGKNRLKQKRKVLVVTTQNAGRVRSKIKQMGIVAEDQVIIYRTDVMTGDEFSKLYLPKCNSITIIGDVQVKDADVINTSIAGLLYDFMCNAPQQKNGPVPCYLSYRDFYFFLSSCKKFKNDQIYFYPFNYYEICIGNVWGYGQLSQEIEPHEDFHYQGLSTYVQQGLLHLVVLGFNIMGQEVVKAAIKWAHFTNSRNRDVKQTKITVIANEKSAVDEFKMRFPQVESELPDIEVEFLLQSPHCQDTFKALQEIVDSAEMKPYVVICSDNSSDNYLMAGHLPVKCYMKHIPVLAQMDYFNEHLVRGMISQERYRNVNFFGFVNNDLSFVADIRVAQQLVYYHARSKGVETKNFQTLWESYSYDNVRQTRLCYLNGLATLIDQLGVRIAQGSEDSVEFSTEKALSILQRQFMGWNFLAGYRASATMDTESDWTYRRINTMFTYEVLKDENGMDLPNRQRQMLEYLKDFIIWLKENNLYLALKDSMSS